MPANSNNEKKGKNFEWNIRSITVAGNLQPNLIESIF